MAQCLGCWPKRRPWHSPCVHTRRAKWKKKTLSTLFQAHGIQWPADVELFVRHRLSVVWCGGETRKPVDGSARAGHTLPPNDAAFQGSKLREGGRGGPTVGGRGLDDSEPNAWGHWSRWRRLWRLRRGIIRCVREVADFS